MSFSNPQLIMIEEIKTDIERMKAAGCDYPKIRETIIKEYKDGNWCVTNKELADECTATALLAYAMDNDKRDAIIKLGAIMATTRDEKTFENLANERGVNMKFKQFNANYKSFEEWAKKNGWLYTHNFEARDCIHYTWLSPIGAVIRVGVNADGKTVSCTVCV